MLQTSELLKKVRQIEIKTGRLVSETFAGEYLSAFKGQGMEFAEVREYVPGDDVRSIDWNVSARTGKTYIKKFAEERELTVMLACDVSASNDFGSKGVMKREAVMEISALFAFSALKNNDRVGLLLFSDKVELYIPPKKGKKHILRIIRELLAFQPASKGTDISAGLNTLNRVIKRSGILVLVSDFMTSEYERAVSLSAKKFDLVPVLVKDSLERELPAVSASINAVDPESGERRVVNLKTRRAGAALERQEAAEFFFKRLGVDFIPADTQKPLADALVRFFKKRERKIRR